MGISRQLPLAASDGKIGAWMLESVLMQPHAVGLGMQMQLVTREAAELILEKTVIFDRPVDTYLQMSWEHRSCRILAISPSGVGEMSRDLGGKFDRTKTAVQRKNSP